MPLPAGRGLLPAHLPLLRLDHLPDHIPADIAGVLGGDVAVVAVVQGDAELAGDLVLHVGHRLLRLGHVDLVVCAIGSHLFSPP